LSLWDPLWDPLWDSSGIHETCVGPHVMCVDTNVGLVACGWLDCLVFSLVFNLACSSTHPTSLPSPPTVAASCQPPPPSSLTAVSAVAGHDSSQLSTNIFFRASSSATDGTIFFPPRSGLRSLLCLLLFKLVCAPPKSTKSFSCVARAGSR